VSFGWRKSAARGNPFSCSRDPIDGRIRSGSAVQILIRQLIARLSIAHGVPLFVWLALREKNGSLWNRSVYGL